MNIADMGEFRAKLVRGERLIGTFIKSPTTHAIEILGDLGFDFVVIDIEHGTFDRIALDMAVLAARASGLAALVRIDAAEPARILQALDAGAAGILAPHVSSVETAKVVANACRYERGSRGFSASTRAGRFGAVSRWDHVRGADKGVVVIAQIEDPSALDHLEAIVGVEGIDALFIGRGDLTVALGLESSEGPEMTAIVAQIAGAAKRGGKAICGFAAGIDEAVKLSEVGATLLVISSDQGFLRRDAARTLKDARERIRA